MLQRLHEIDEIKMPQGLAVIWFISSVWHKNGRS